MTDRLTDALDELARREEATQALLPAPEDQLQEWSTERLQSARQGCTEMSCIYHGPYNRVLQERQAR